MLGSLVVLYWLYMGSQSRFYARWMLPLYPALAILAAYAVMQLKRSASLFAALAIALLLVPTADPDGPQRARAWAARTRARRRATGSSPTCPPGTKVAFEPIAPTEWYGVTPGGGAEGRPAASQWQRFNRSQADIAELARSYRGARRPANFQNYERTLTPKLIDVYRREGVCWVVSGSTQYGRAQAEPERAPEALKYYRALNARRPTSCSRASPLRNGRSLPRYQVDTLVQLRRRRRTTGPGPQMIVYRLRNCG